MMVSPWLIAPLTGELACTSHGFTPLCALMRKACPPGRPSTAKYLALGLSGITFQTPFESLLMVLLQMSSSASATVPRAKPASKNVQNLMRQPLCCTHPCKDDPSCNRLSGILQILRKELHG